MNTLLIVLIVLAALALVAVLSVTDVYNTCREIFPSSLIIENTPSPI